jgi:RNA recognition motif-containing protein
MLSRPRKRNSDLRGIADMADENRDNDTDMDNDPPPEDGQEQTRSDDNQNGEVIGSTAMRPVFLGNLNTNFAAADVKDVFETADPPIPVDRVDIKRGYCFVFLRDAASEADKQRAENFVSDINGM